MLYPIALGMPGGAEWIVIAAIGLLLFGKRLPEVGRSLGKGIVEFKKGLKGVEDEMETASDAKPAQPVQQPQLTTNTAPAAAALPHKFDPYTGKPIENATTTSQT
jgi:sec-independent protein translocase protein TatA